MAAGSVSTAGRKRRGPPARAGRAEAVASGEQHRCTRHGRFHVRKLLAAALCACAAIVPAVALAADGSNTTKNQAGTGIEKRQERRDAKSQLRKAVARAERKQRAHARKRAAGKAKSFGGGGSASPALQAIAACESGGNPSAIGGGGAYRGKYQFSYSTWAAVGGSGDPAAASEAEQDARAAKLYASSGAGQWPVCGR